MPENTPNEPTNTDNDLREALAERTQMAHDLADQLRARDAQLNDLRDRASRLERRGSIERGLAQAGALDTESLALLVESRLEGDDDATPQRVIAQLQRERPALFRASSARVGHEPEPSLPGRAGSRGGRSCARRRTRHRRPARPHEVPAPATRQLVTRPLLPLSLLAKHPILTKGESHGIHW